MTLEEKIELCSGESFWHTKGMDKHGIPKIMLADGPHGLRKQNENADMLGINNSVPATCFPTAVSTACSWDESLMGEIGEAIGKEAAANGVGVVLGPGANIKRNPLCGRNFEYFSEDPLLGGKMAAGFIRGVESTGTGSSLKHFAFNNQEYKRFSSNSIMDERTMREIYLRGFEIAVKEGKPSTVMSAYNKINGTHCSESKLLLSDILRDEWGFDGMVVTDWGALGNRIEAFRAGCDLCMPGGAAFMEKEAADAVHASALDESAIESSARRILKQVLASQQSINNASSAEMDAHNALAKKAATESAVLMKNENNLLPLNTEDNAVFIGHMAKEMRYQGAGSSHINPWKLTSPTDACPSIPFVEGCDKSGNSNEAQLHEAAAAAKAAKTVVVFAGLTSSFESEGFDRESMALPLGHIKLIETVAAANPNTVVVLMCGSPVEMPWADKVKAILYMGLPGQAGGEAVADLLFGKAVPCGKLAESWPFNYADCVCADYYANGQKDAHYREGVYVGYRYYATAAKAVRYPFGHGLSYTAFSYSDISYKSNSVTLCITNTGKMTAKEVVQLYITPPKGKHYRPALELKAFAKVELNPDESKTITLTLNQRSFAIWDGGWVVPAGVYTLYVGGSSDNLPLSIEVEVTDTQLTVNPNLPAWYTKPCAAPTHADFEGLLGHKITTPQLKKGSFTLDNTVMEMKDYSIIARIIYKAVERTVAKGFNGKADYSNPDFRMLMYSASDASISAMIINSGMRNHMLEGMLKLINGHFFKGLYLLLFKKKR